MQRKWHEAHISSNARLNLSCKEGGAFGEAARTGSSPFHTSPAALLSGEVSDPLSSHWCNLSDLLIVSTAWKHINMEHCSKIWSWICPGQVQTFLQGLWRQMSPKETVSTMSLPPITGKANSSHAKLSLEILGGVVTRRHTLLFSRRVLKQ